MGGPEVVDWLRAEWNRAGCRRPQSDDIAGLLEARSASVALAVAGDSSHLYDFVDHMSDQPSETANLNYWAYWIGELNDEQTTDTFMMNADTHSWTGSRLLSHLMQRLDPTHSLVPSRPTLLSGHHVCASLSEVLDRLSSIADLSHTERDQLAGLQYAVRIADR